jgi:EAL domain-containing protein (putative c-di-GMP-specific phosphodiesterase class I)
VAVNLSVATLADPRLLADVGGLLDLHGVPAAALQIEITETALADDPARARAALAGLRDMGVGLAIDDYGAGYSSLAYLRDLQVDELKLDRSFVTGLGGDPTNAAIVRSTLDLARALGLRLVAEGVETEADWASLRSLDCDLAQGFGIARPLPLPALHDWLAERDGERAA